ncbi:MAG: hypothetical protein FJW21_01300 [Acidimicrobiia bacterium]|nr:hypothetical protein [Acidimicrobiia bacterium]
MRLLDLFRRRIAAPPQVTEWWKAATALTTAPAVDGVAALKASIVSDEEAARVTDAKRDLPVLTTQHRVIGTDT